MSRTRFPAILLTTLLLAACPDGAPRPSDDSADLPTDATIGASETTVADASTSWSTSTGPTSTGETGDGCGEDPPPADCLPECGAKGECPAAGMTCQRVIIGGECVVGCAHPCTVGTVPPPGCGECREVIPGDPSFGYCAPFGCAG